MKDDAEILARKSLLKSDNTMRLSGKTQERKSEFQKNLPDDLSKMSVLEMNQLAYKTMNPIIYYVVTLVLYAVEVYLAIVVTNIGDVFGFIGTIAGTSLSFFIPSVLFCKSY